MSVTKIEIASNKAPLSSISLSSSFHRLLFRCMLIYDGIHYDALALAKEASAPEEADATLFDTDVAELVDLKARSLVEEQHQQRKWRGQRFRHIKSTQNILKS